MIFTNVHICKWYRRSFNQSNKPKKIDTVRNGIIIQISFQIHDLRFVVVDIKVDCRFRIPFPHVRLCSVFSTVIGGKFHLTSFIYILTFFCKLLYIVLIDISICIVFDHDVNTTENGSPIVISVGRPCLCVCVCVCH